MNCCITELRCKEIINKANGCRLGFVSDIEVDKCSGRVVALIVYGRPKYFGICGKREAWTNYFKKSIMLLWIGRLR